MLESTPEVVQCTLAMAGNIETEKITIKEYMYYMSFYRVFRTS